jgi:hypothetical protein
MRTMIGLAAALGLAACGEPASNAPATTPPAEAPATGPVTLNTIPANFQGVWAATEADCTAPAETRLVIAANELTFYESSGPVASVTAENPTEIHLVVALTGEGALSQRTFRYRLLEDGAALFDVRNGLTRRRCG